MVVDRILIDSWSILDLFFIDVSEISALSRFWVSLGWCWPPLRYGKRPHEFWKTALEFWKTTLEFWKTSCSFSSSSFSESPYFLLHGFQKRVMQQLPHMVHRIFKPLLFLLDIGFFPVSFHLLHGQDFPRTCFADLVERLPGLRHRLNVQR